MKAIFCKDGEIQIFNLECTDDAYHQGDRMHPGYQLRTEDDFVIDDGEYVGLHLQMSMYEGAESAGSYWAGEEILAGKFGWSWAVMPETAEESEHLRKFCPNTLFRPMNV